MLTIALIALAVMVICGAGLGYAYRGYRNP